MTSNDETRAPGSSAPLFVRTLAADRQTMALEDLTLGTRLGGGGQAEVFELPESDLLVAKRYFGHISVDDVALHALVSRPLAMTGEQQDMLADRTSWPLNVIAAGGESAGVLIRRAPEHFYLDERPDRLAEISYLMLPDRSQALDVTIPDALTRLQILRSMAEVLAMLHGLGISHGDISMRNLLWSRSEPYVFFLDCDGARVEGLGAALPHVVTPHWEDPRLTRREIDSPDIQSDCRSFALAFYRLYFTRRGHDLAIGSPNSLPRDPFLTSDLKRLLVEGLGDAPRPSMDCWLGPINELIESGRSLGEVEAHRWRFDSDVQKLDPALQDASEQPHAKRDDLTRREAKAGLMTGAQFALVLLVFVLLTGLSAVVTYTLLTQN